MAKKKSTATENLPPAVENASGVSESSREPSDGEKAHIQQKKSSWQPWVDIAEPLDEQAKRDMTKGEVARHFEGYNRRGVGVRIDSPDESWRPSDYVKEALKEVHPGRDSLRWKKEALHEKGTFHKDVIGRRKTDGAERNPVAERLDSESRFAEAVRRRKEEKSKDGPDPS